MPIVSLFVASLLANPALAVDDIAVPGSPTVAYAAVVDLQGASDGEIAALNVLAGCMAQGGRTYTRNVIASTDGVAALPQVEVGEGYLLVRLAVSARTPRLGADLMASVVSEPVINEDTVRIGQSRLKVQPDLVSRAWNPTEIKADVTVKEVEYVFRKFVRPDRTNFCIAGAVPMADALQTANWTWPAAPERREFIRHRREILSESLAGANAWTLRIPLGAKGGDLAAGTMVANLMGVGKASAMFRVLRHEAAYSYRQEAGLIPTRKGWELGLVAYSTQATSEEVVKGFRERLGKAVGHWTDADVKRARRQWEAATAGVFPFDPVHSSPGLALGNGAWGEAAMGGLNRLIMGRPVSRKLLLGMAENPRVEDLQKLALDCLNRGALRILAAR